MAASRSAQRQLALGRGWARRLAMQALYQWQMTDQPPDLIESQFGESPDLAKADLTYFRELLHGVCHHRVELDAAVDPYLDRPAVQLDPVERAVLWIAGYELLKRRDVPYRVVINEAVDLTKLFGAEKGHRFVNGVLDRLAHSTRAEEMEQT